MNEPKIKKRIAVKRKNIEKLERKELVEKQKQIKPKECMKYIKVQIDPICLEDPHGITILPDLNVLNIQYEVKKQKVSGIISWTRELRQTLLSSEGQIQLSDKFESVNTLLFLMQGQEVVRLIKNNDLTAKINNLKEIYPNETITLIIFGLQEYCRLKKNIVGRKQIELSLTELQLFNNCNHRLLERAADFSNCVVQFSKSIAELPYKQQLNEKYHQEDFYIMNDNRDCVPVKDSNGLSRLWQQHLIKLPLVTLETAQAIMEKYPMPKNLLQAYENCDVNEGEHLLSDISVKRAGYSITSGRKIGPELSRKVYTLYTTKDPNKVIG